MEDVTNPQEKATLYTREQLIAMGRIIEAELNDQNLGGGNADLSKLSEVQQKTQQRSLYNQPLSRFRMNNSDDPAVVMNKIASVMQRTSVDGLMQTPDGRFWTEEVNKAPRWGAIQVPLDEKRQEYEICGILGDVPRGL